jgi:hypothetical protein
MAVVFFTLQRYFSRSNLHGDSLVDSVVEGQFHSLRGADVAKPCVPHGENKTSAIAADLLLRQLYLKFRKELLDGKVEPLEVFFEHFL